VTGAPVDTPVMNSIGVLLDLENILHSARSQGPAAVRAGLVRAMHQLRDLGQVSWAVASCDWWLARTVLPAAAACGVRVHPGPCGQDRADHELLRRSADVPTSVGTLVIASGDGAFLPAVHEHRMAGRQVVVDAVHGALSAQLALAADRVVLLDMDSPGQITVAS
jgi:hypothetical protein